MSKPLSLFSWVCLKCRHEYVPTNKGEKQLAILTVQELRNQLEPFDGADLLVVDNNGASFQIKELILSDATGDAVLTVENMLATSSDDASNQEDGDDEE